MIEFNGYITGSAKKRFLQKEVLLAQWILISAALIFLPISIMLSVQMRDYLLVQLNCIMIGVIFLMVRIPKRKKEERAITPKLIYTDGETIVCVAEKYTETKYISDVKMVKDHEEYYELVFPFGKVSGKFICQKGLLTKGSLEEFENLFIDKIQKI